jgi:hypothetical protein
MPKSLTIKQHEKDSLLTQIALGFVIVPPIAGLGYCWRFGRDIRFDNPSLNLAAHASLIFFPLLWAVIMGWKPFRLEPTEEFSLGTSSYFGTFRANWWMMLLVWPTAIFAVFALGYAIFTDYLPHPENLLTSPLRGILIVATTLLLGMFYLALLLNRSSPRTLVSSEGLRTGILRFFEWSNIHHMRRDGDIYLIYHHVNPALPATCFRVSDKEARAVLERHILEQQVAVLKDEQPIFMWIKLAVIMGFIGNLAFAIWLWHATALSLLWVDLISLAVGIVLTLLLEKYRGISKWSKYKPIVEMPEE